MTQSEEKRDPQPSDENLARQLKAAHIFMEKYKEVLRELAKH